MATTYKKVLRTIAIKTLGGTTVNAADTATDPIASDAIRDFEGKGTMHVRGANGAVTLIPFAAVDSIAVTVAATDVTRPDAYCEEETEPTVEP